LFENGLKTLVLMNKPPLEYLPPIEQGRVHAGWLKLIPTMIFGFLLVLASSVAEPATQTSENQNRAKRQAFERLRELSLEELLQVQIYSATLTDTDRRLVPAAVMRITRDQIDSSGARDLDELLEIYVPGFQWMHKTNGGSIGIRGIISDRNTKHILLVNGRVMNHRGVFGVFSERMLSVLGDIDYVEVVRGRGSAIYGPGAPRTRTETKVRWKMGADTSAGRDS
jgi:outer membrane cobalamin receptor